MWSTAYVRLPVGARDAHPLRAVPAGGEDTGAPLDGGDDAAADVAPPDGRADDAGLLDAGLADAGEDAGLFDASVDAGTDAGSHFPDAPDALLSVSPAFATAGRPLMLEGRFREPVVVTFPGGAEVEAEVLGSGGARVDVPAAARAGALEVTSGVTALGGPFFRRPSFAVELGPFERGYAQTTTARRMPTLFVPRQDHAALVIGRYVYVLGGRDGEQRVSLVERAPINADGTLGAFEEADIGLVTPRAEAAVVRAGEWVYVLAGTRDGVHDGVLSTVERAPIIEGALGPFELVPDVSLVEGRAHAAAAVVGPYLYAIGGRSAGGALLASVERAEIGPEGALSPFVVTSAELVEAGQRHEAVVVGDRLYVLGGIAGAEPFESVESALIAGDGSLGAFESEPSLSLTAPRAGFDVLLVDGALYAIGGDPAGSIEAAPIGSERLEPFSAHPATLVAGRRGHRVVLVENNVYAIGGKGEDGLLPVEVASLVRGQDFPSGFIDSGLDLSTGHTYGSLVVLGDRLYVIGGSRRNDYEWATVDASGISSFTLESAPALSSQHDYGGLVVAKGKVHIVGGIANVGTDDETFIDLFDVAEVQPSGALGSFMSYGGLPEGICCSGGAMLGGFFYLIGGLAQNAQGVVDFLSNSYRVDLRSGAFTTDAVGLALQRLRRGHRTVVVRDRLYVIGGWNDSADILRVEWAELR